MPKPQDFTEQTVVQNEDIVPFLKSLGGGLYEDSNITKELLAQSLALTQGNRLIFGGRIVWLSGYTFRVSPAEVDFNGLRKDYIQTDLTLDAPDPTDARVDLIVADKNTGTIVKITGTPSTPPVAPEYDPINQFSLNSITVDPVTSQPTNIARTWVYQEGIAEWTFASSGGTFNSTSTNNPFAGTKDIEATTSLNAHYFKLTSGTTLDVNDYDILYFYIRPKASWGTRYLKLNWETAAGARKGDFFSLSDGVLGFSSSTLGYQLVVIPINFFNIKPGTLVQTLRMTVVSTSGSIGFYVDDIAIQSGIGPSPTSDTFIAAAGVAADGVDLTAGKTGSTLLVKRLRAGTGIVLTAETNGVLVESSAPGSLIFNAMNFM